MDATATMKRRPRPNGSRFTLTESSTVRRRPKSRDKDPEGQLEVLDPREDQTTDGQVVPYQNGTGTVKRQPESDVGVAEQSPPLRRQGSDLGGPGGPEGAPLRKPKPPVSPKPVLVKRNAPPHPTKRVPLPGPGTPGSPGTAGVCVCVYVHKY